MSASPRRFTLSAFCFTCLALSYMDRWNLSIAAPLLMKEFGWNETTMGLLQSVFFYGFTLTHLPGGWLADRFGGRRVLGAGTLGWTLATGVTPLGGSFAALAAARVALGLGEGLNMPSISSLVARWFPLEERTRATVVNLTGIHTGTLVALPLSGWIAATWGWRPIFYIYALVGLVWVALWFLWAPEPPLTGAEPARVVRVPWALLLRRRAVWALLGTTFITNWTAWFMYSWVPTYFIQAHGFSLLAQGERRGVRRAEPGDDRRRAGGRLGGGPGHRGRAARHPRAQGDAGQWLRRGDGVPPRATARPGRLRPAARPARWSA